MQEAIVSLSFDAAVYYHARYSGYWAIVPEMSYKDWRADFICWGPKKGILEIEVKHSWSDYQNDFFKDCRRRQLKISEWRCFRNVRDKNIPRVSKHEWLLGQYPSSWAPTHFLYAAPLELAKE